MPQSSNRLFGNRPTLDVQVFCIQADQSRRFRAAIAKIDGMTNVAWLPTMRPPNAPHRDSLGDKQDKNKHRDAISPMAYMA
jgi:hypothetical protein